MKITSPKFAVVTLFSFVLIGCASQPAQVTTTTTETTTKKTPMDRGNGLASYMH
jgi:hypothetical protein